MRHCIRGIHGGLSGSFTEDSRERAAFLKIYNTSQNSVFFSWYFVVPPCTRWSPTTYVAPLTGSSFSLTLLHYCKWSVIQSQSPISIYLVSFPNVVSCHPVPADHWQHIIQHCKLKSRKIRANRAFNEANRLFLVEYKKKQSIRARCKFWACIFHLLK